MIARGEQVEVVAMCDCDEKRMQAAAVEAEKRTGKKPALHADFRKLLDDRSIDAVALATPNHWHALQTIWACQAGKDVYVEKPCSHNIFEGRKMVEAARKYQRIVQHGTQCRTSPKIREGIEKLHAGVIGRVYMARGIAYKVRAGGRKIVKPVPPNMHWDLWLGPAPEEGYNELCHHPLAIPQKLRQRRDRRPGRPPVGHHPLGLGPRYAPHAGAVDGRPPGPSRRRRGHPRQPESSPASMKGKTSSWYSKPAIGTPTPRRAWASSIRLSTIATWWA